MSRFLRGWRFTVSSAINMFYKQIILQQGIPFDVKLPKAPENSAKWSKERLDAELEKGYNDMLKGRTRPAAMVLSDVKKKYKELSECKKA
ncbi:type II toxin-antitoxin system RelB/DinJ family antitoxin [Fibrobacter sp. UBA2449]|uniref:type II toxin-antitoxin system RelB/DinJ family antitoxin n=1 Tax=Fibrobacter sp. UBA2449 TaxID=1946529 RepID=UPI0025B9A7DC|nr:type II toxin-antitoxin system RelB/DinJ family antitoxin [Fibrobacter sp. UBA2449]MBR6123577.1 type II toxin-antitoxin system RelB/DinJ family antitoxin [Candidatus Saccharibacteria bacterium]